MKKESMEQALKRMAKEECVDPSSLRTAVHNLLQEAKEAARNHEGRDKQNKYLVIMRKPMMKLSKKKRLNSNR